MLTPRDKSIIKTLTLFRCLSRDQVASLFFQKLKNPITSANYVLKRLRREGYITANIEYTPYVYFPNPSLIKTSSQKIRHYLAIADFYIDICKHEKPSVFLVEPRYGSEFMQPDIFMIWKNQPFFVEIQKSIYSSKVMMEKIGRYVKYYESGEWKKQDWQQPNAACFPVLWIVSKNSYSLSLDKIQTIQTSDVESYFH
ncbi:replication-relaxation family protein [Priestia abyssalis]|uniref:replication-relaxation family protein n=1 Tax=Priestia abyssalis TaxID=1221450 RepID=UPI0009959E67|nr:replication-relaxation family protein [Priestia abyssalis]